MAALLPRAAQNNLILLDQKLSVFCAYFDALKTKNPILQHKISVHDVRGQCEPKHAYSEVSPSGV